MSLKISSTMHEPASGKAPAPKKPPFIGSPLLVAIKRIAQKTGKGIRSLIRTSAPSKRDVEVPIVEPRKAISAKKSVSVKKTPVNEETQSKAATPRRQPGAAAWLPKLLWGVSALMVVLVIYLGLNFLGIFTTAVSASTQIQTTPQAAVLPTYASTPMAALERVTDPKTTLSDRGDDYIQRYIVQPLEGVYSIATKFNIKPETVLWSNESELRSDPNTIPVNSVLYIPPVDGVYYPWKEGDTLEKVAAKFEVTPNDILTWPSNHLDLTNPVIVPGQYVMIPNGKGSAIEWVVPIPYSAHSGSQPQYRRSVQCHRILPLVGRIHLANRQPLDLRE